MKNKIKFKNNESVFKLDMSIQDSLSQWLIYFEAKNSNILQIISILVSIILTIATIFAILTPIWIIFRNERKEKDKKRFTACVSLSSDFEENEKIFYVVDREGIEGYYAVELEIKGWIEVKRLGLHFYLPNLEKFRKLYSIIEEHNLMDRSGSEEENIKKGSIELEKIRKLSYPLKKIIDNIIEFNKISY